MEPLMSIPTASISVVTQTDERRPILSAGAMLASVLLHGIALACVVGWLGGGTKAEVTAIAVSLVQDTLPQASVGSTVASAPAIAVAPLKPIEVAALPPAPSTPAKPETPATRAQPAAEPHRADSVKSATTTKAAPTTVHPAPSAPILPPAPLAETHGSVGKDKATSTVGHTGSAASPTGPDGAASPAAGNAPPHYPHSAREAGREGRAVLSVVVTPDGTCKDLKIIESSGTPPLDQAALEAVRQWHFTPAIRDGSRIETTIRVPITFNLTDPE